MKLTTGRLIDDSSYGGIDMVIKDLDLEPKIDAMMRGFLDTTSNLEPKQSCLHPVQLAHLFKSISEAIGGFSGFSNKEPEAPVKAPPSPDYVLGPEHPPSPGYVHGPEEPKHAPLSLDYVHEPKYPEYLVSFDAEAPMEDQPLPDDASPIALSPGYIVGSDPKEDLEEDPADYPTDGGDNADDESSEDNDDEDDDDEEQEASEDDDEEEKEKHPALANSSVVPVVNLVSSAEDIEAIETDESAPTSVPSPRRRTASEVSIHAP
ncbi:hypothetical protein Tco_0532984 [Tanacetum coccineum]